MKIDLRNKVTGICRNLGSCWLMGRVERTGVCRCLCVCVCVCVCVCTHLWQRSKSLGILGNLGEGPDFPRHVEWGSRPFDLDTKKD